MATASVSGSRERESGGASAGQRSRNSTSPSPSWASSSGPRSPGRQRGGRFPPADLLVLAQLRLPDAGRRPQGARPALLGRRPIASGCTTTCSPKRSIAACEAGKTFAEIFGELAERPDLDELARNFSDEGVQAAAGGGAAGPAAAWLTDREILDMDLPAFDVAAVRTGRGGQAEAALPGGSARALARRAGGRSRFRDLGRRNAYRLARCSAHLAELRGVRINMEFNGALCRGSSDARYKEAGVVDGEPTLVDFIMDRVPARAAPTA